ncbi:MAG: hypothetical protein FWG40_02500 [Peptococcaceae bacterium]|nr:hypothetical protein [Peptococcaceae bacterium]
MKKFTVVIAVSLCFLLGCSQIIVAFGLNNEMVCSTAPTDDGIPLFVHTEEDVIAKQAMDEKYAANYVEMTEEQLAERDALINGIIADSTISDNERNEQLEALQVYPYVSPNENAYLATQASDVTLNSVSIYKDTVANQWKLSSSGSYKSSSSYSSECAKSKLTYSVGDTWNVGGHDAVGIALTQPYGNSAGVARVGGYGLFAGHDGYSIANYNGCTADDRYGVVYKLQDYSYVTSCKLSVLLVWSYTYRYYGHGFHAFANYNSNFSNWHGNAKLFYAHTWSSTNINGFSVSTSGFGTSWSSSNYRWDVYGLSKVF